MPLDCPYLDLSPHWAGDDGRDDIIVVRGMDGVRLCTGGGYEKVAAAKTIAQLRRMGRTLERQMSDFLVRTSLDMPGGRAASLQQTVREIADFIKHGSYLGLRRRRAERWADDPNVEERLLVRDIEGGMRGHIHVGGRRYRLVAGADIAGVPDRNSYEVVPHDDAVRVLDELTLEHAAQVALAQNLKKASAKLSPDWRPPLPPKGIVLLRRLATRPVASVKPTPVLTPSQMRAMMKKQPGNITFLEVPEYIASGSETVSLRYGFDDPDGRLTDVVLEIFTDDDRAARLWSRKVPSEHVAAGKGSMDWDGKLDSSDEEFPDGFATITASPYVVKLNAKDGGASMLRQAKIRVEVAEVKLTFGPESCLSQAGDQEAFGRMLALREKRLVRLRAQSFITWSALGTDLGEATDIGHQLAVAPWGNGAGARIPLIATVSVWDSRRQPRVAGKALGHARVMWDYVEPAPGAVPREGANNGNYLRTVEQYDQANVGPPNGRNAHEVIGGKRSPKGSARRVLASPDGDSAISGFPFKSDAGKTRFWSAFAETHRSGEREGQAGIVLRPSAISGDAYQITAYVDVDGALDSLEPVAGAVPRGEAGWFEIWREVPLVRFARKSPEVEIGLSDISDYTDPAYLSWNDQCEDKQEILGKPEYLAAVQAGLAASPSGDSMIDRHALLPVADQYDMAAGFFSKLFGGPERELRATMINFRTFDEFIDACKGDKSISQYDVEDWKALGSEDYEQFARRWSWTLAGSVGSAFAAAGGVSVAAFSDVHNLGEYRQLGGIAAAHPTDRSRITILLFRGGADTLAHELGHCLFLPHASSAPGIEISGVMTLRHMPGTSQCMMAYGTALPGFCAICLLRLRGGSGDRLRPNGLVP